MDKAIKKSGTFSVPEPLVAFVDDDRGYLVWLSSNPGGYVLNTNRTPGTELLTMHRATCPSITEGNQRWTADYAKVCGPTTAAIDSWLYQSLAATSEPCKFCYP